MKFQRIRTLWGVEPGKDMENWDKLFPELKQIGFGTFASQAIPALGG